VTASDVIAELALATKEQMAAVVAPLLERIAVLEATLAAQPALDVVAAKAALLIPRPIDGKDAPPIDVDAIAAKAAALVPRPSDGKDAPPVDLEALAVKAAALIPVPRDGRDGERGRDGENGIDGKDGAPGKDAAPIDLEALAVKAAALVPHGRDGRDGKDAPPVDVQDIAIKAALLVSPVEDIEARVAEALEVAVKALPQPKDGTHGRDGRDGKDVDAALLETIVAASVERVLSGWERPKDGKSLTPEDVAPLIKAEVAAVTADLRSGADGVGITGALIDQDGCLQLTKSDGTTQHCGRVVGAPGRDADMALLQKQITDEIALIPKPKDGQDGAPGKDGLGIEDSELIVDEQKGYVFRWSNADRVKEQPVALPFDRGTYRAGMFCRKGSLVTAQGSLWIALRDTSDRPGEGSKSWRLAVKRGRDGRDVERLP
jgi:hypothetical protein